MQSDDRARKSSAGMIMPSVNYRQSYGGQAWMMKSRVEDSKRKALPTRAEMERAYLARDASYEGIFLVAVKTTGIFCRPTCRVKSPLPRNVEFFANAHDAMFAGYRACKRCRPTQMDDQPSWATELLAELDADPSARITEYQLRRRGIDPATVRRHFIKHYGMTFHAYSRAKRLGKALAMIRNGKSVDHAVNGSGYDSESGFREAFASKFGTAPSGSKDVACIYLAWLPSPIGPMIAGANDEGVCLLEFTDRRMLEHQVNQLQKYFRVPIAPGHNRHLEQLSEELAGYFVGKVRTFRTPIVYPGTPFQQKVWKGLLSIEYGKTISYQELATQVGDVKAVRAVGRTNGLNRIGIVIPCHRVINKDGSLCGYGGGLHRKKFLLDLEKKYR